MGGRGGRIQAPVRGDYTLSPVRGAPNLSPPVRGGGARSLAPVHDTHTLPPTRGARTLSPSVGERGAHTLSSSTPGVSSTSGSAHDAGPSSASGGYDTVDLTPDEDTMTLSSNDDDAGPSPKRMCLGGAEGTSGQPAKSSSPHEVRQSNCILIP